MRNLQSVEDKVPSWGCIVGKLDLRRSRNLADLESWEQHFACSGRRYRRVLVTGKDHNTNEDIPMTELHIYRKWWRATCQ